MDANKPFLLQHLRRNLDQGRHFPSLQISLLPRRRSPVQLQALRPPGLRLRVLPLAAPLLQSPQEYGVAVEYYLAPYLVEVAAVDGKKVLQLDEVAGGGEEWRTADVVSFHTGHWWTHTGGLQGWDYIEFGGSYYTDMNRLAAMKRALTTWANWVDSNVDRAKTKVFFQSIPPTHSDPSEWSDPVSKNCYGETSPVSGWADFRGTYPDQMKVVDDVVGTMRDPPYLLDITALSVLRKDAHPSIYSGDLNPVQRANPDRSADCSHWCLPGLPDTWNILFYTALFF